MVRVHGGSPSITATPKHLPGPWCTRERISTVACTTGVPPRSTRRCPTPATPSPPADLHRNPWASRAWPARPRPIGLVTETERLCLRRGHSRPRRPAPTKEIANDHDVADPAHRNVEIQDVPSPSPRESIHLGADGLHRREHQIGDTDHA